ncbi:MAG: hypothetical protein L6Q84_04515 [Polyangiaceae bacterium]|nr:hypothetical protein [Polyangiaceae bacterium]
MRCVAALLVPLALAPPASAEPAKKALEVGAFGGHSWMLRVHTENEERTWQRNGGEAFAAYAAYRSPYFLAPFVDVGYFPLFASQETREVGPPFGTLGSTNSLVTWSFMAGPAFDVWRLRFRAGMGAYYLRVRSTVLGQTVTPSELDGGYLFAVSGWFLRQARVRVGAEARLGLIVEADTPLFALGATLGGDALTW